jgi:hypothetical protein
MRGLRQGLPVNGVIIYFSLAVSRIDHLLEKLGEII